MHMAVLVTSYIVSGKIGKKERMPEGTGEMLAPDYTVDKHYTEKMIFQCHRGYYCLSLSLTMIIQKTRSRGTKERCWESNGSLMLFLHFLWVFFPPAFLKFYVLQYMASAHVNTNAHAHQKQKKTVTDTITEKKQE